MDLDNIDMRIVSEMLSNSRESLRSIARKLGIPTSSTHDRVKRLARAGLIRRFTLELDPVKLGLNITVLVLMRVRGPYIVEVEKSIAGHPNIVAIYDITGEYDVAVVAKFPSMSEVNGFIKGLLKNPMIERTVTSVVLNTVKESYCPRELPIGSM